MNTRQSSDPKYQLTQQKQILSFLLFALAGVLTDFLVCGVFKILWITIYAAVYLGLAATLYNYVLESFWHRFVFQVSIGFLVGAGVGHVILTGWTSQRNYSMKIVSDKPITLESPEFSDRLFVSSKKLSQKIEGHAGGATFPISILVVKNYGCIASFKISAVDNIDVMLDPEATWVWKSQAGFASPDAGINSLTVDGTKSGMQEENSRLPWCLIQWF